MLLLGLNMRASIKCVNSPYSDLKQKIFQLAFVWFIPVVGALMVLILSQAMDVNPNYKTHDADPASPEKISFGSVNPSGDGSGGNE